MSARPRRGWRRARAARPRSILPRSLGAKLVLILTAVGVAGALGITLLLGSVITPNFRALEAKATGDRIARTHAALSGFASGVAHAARDHRDRGRDDDRLRDADGGVEAFARVAPDGRVRILQWRGGGATERSAAQRALAAVIREGGLARGRASHGYARLAAKVVAIGIAPDGAGGHGAAVLAVRELTAARLSAMLGLAARLDPAAGDRASVTSHRTTMAIAVPVMAPGGRAVASVRFQVVRDVSILGRRMLLLAVAGSILLLLIVLIVLRRMIAHLVLAPLQRVERHMQRVRASGSMALIADDARSDEFGSLGRSLNAMLAQLKALREQIEAQSFALGRSESAVAVMHNVRNALNPISIILSRGIAQPPPIDGATVARALAELAGDGLPGERRAKLAAFVGAAFAAEDAARETVRGELQVGREAMAHVLEIIGEQQREAHERPAIEPCDLTEIVARNATIARYAQDASIAFSFPAGCHRAMANRVILSQVIGNILANAAEAIAAGGEEGGFIRVTIAEAGEQVAITVRDTGEGFDADAAATLFQRGYSTRRHKSGGLGLHWCANAMTAMGGSLRLTSEGRGRGAGAVLTLQAVRQDAAAA